MSFIFEYHNGSLKPIQADGHFEAMTIAAHIHNVKFVRDAKSGFVLYEVGHDVQVFNLAPKYYRR